MQRYYFDHNATAPVAPGVLRQLPELMEVYGNASSIHHFGQSAKQKLEGARREIAGHFGCDPRELVFTGGGTESDNLGIFGVVRASARPSKHVIASAAEHPAVLNACGQLEREGVEVTYLPVDSRGQIDAADVRLALRPDTVLIAIMHANNETGIIQPVDEISAIAREAAVPFFSDGVQAAGRIPVNLKILGPDLYSVSGHKFGAGKGIGCLFVRKSIAMAPLFFGGHHERDRRAGTENVTGAAMLAAALREPCWTGLSELRDRLERGVVQRVPCIRINGRINGAAAQRIPNTTNICFEGIEGEAMVIALDLRGFAVSSGSACSSGAIEPSHVLLAMGLSREDARSSVRFSLGPSNTADQVDALIEAVGASVAHLRRISPAVLAHA